MDNANKAIIMAFGMLVAILILGTVVFVFTRLSSLPVQDDSLEEVEQRRLFNQEYEVYDKKIMYGVDIISVLNKAQSNNEKYVKSKFFSGIGYNTDYIINIVVTIKRPLQETVKVTYLKSATNKVIETDYSNGDGPNTGGPVAIPTLNNLRGIKAPDATYQNLIYGGGVSNFWTQPLKSVAEDTSITAKTYQILNGSTIVKPTSDGVTNYTDEMIEDAKANPSNYSVLRALLTQSATMSQSVRNNGTNTGEGGWNRVTWYPAIYDLKTRKFKCEGDKVIYSKKTGRIVYMEFTEV